MRNIPTAAARFALPAFPIALLMCLALVGSGRVYAQTAQAEAKIEVPSIVALPWSADSSTITPVQGVVTLDGQPVAGARVAVGGYRLLSPTDAQGQFTYPVDHTLIRRRPVHIIDAANATVGGNPLSAAQQAALEQAEGSINVHYEVVDLSTGSNSDGSIVVTGTVQFANGQPPPPVVLYSYRLTGTVTNTQGEPVEGIIVATRSSEGRLTFSQPAGPQGAYTSLFWPTETTPFRILLIDHDESFAVEGGTGVRFPLYQSTRMDVTLDRAQGTITVTEPVSVSGLIYDGLIVGVTHEGAPVRPLSVTWPDAQGRFQMVLPAELQGQTVQWWQQSGNYFSTIPAEPGGEIGLDEWPAELAPSIPRGFGTVEIP